MVRVPGVSPCGSRGSAGRCSGSSSPSGLHHPPRPSCPRPPWSSRQRPRGNEPWEPGEGERRRPRPRAGAAGAARPLDRDPRQRLSGPGRARRASAGSSERRAASVHRRRGPRGGRAEPLPRAGPGGVESLWAAPGSPRPDSRAGGLFPPGKFTKPGDAKLGNKLGCLQPWRRSCQMFFIILPFI